MKINKLCRLVPFISIAVILFDGFSLPAHAKEKKPSPPHVCNSDHSILSKLFSSDQSSKSTKPVKSSNNQSFFRSIIHQDSDFNKRITKPLESGNPNQVERGLQNLDQDLKSINPRNKIYPGPSSFDVFYTKNNVATVSNALAVQNVAAGWQAVAAHTVAAFHLVAVVTVVAPEVATYDFRYHNQDRLITQSNIAKLTSILRCNVPE